MVILLELLKIDRLIKSIKAFSFVFRNSIINLVNLS